MASWMVHLRIADKILDRFPQLSFTEYVVGNIAPDSGTPNDDWSVFTPSGDVSHFKTTDIEGFKDIHLNEFIDKYLTEEQKKQYSNKQKSFYLGYLTHLLADKMWSNEIVRPSKEKFRAFLLYSNAVGFINDYMEFFSKDAFDKRREYIISFYSSEKDNLVSISEGKRDGPVCR